MLFSARSFTRMANNAPGQQMGKQHPSPIRCERMIIKQHGQHHPKRPEKKLSHNYRSPKTLVYERS